MASLGRIQAPRPNKSPSRDGTAVGKARLVVSLNAKPRDYIPNTGPPLQAIRLTPPRDSTAYIIERILLPPDETGRDGKPRPKRMTYIVGWHDLPAARLLVPAMDILEYVSPCALEDWESALEQELDEDRAKLEGEKNNDAITTGKRRRGRPPAHTQIESAVAAELETEEDGEGRLKGGALSLSTPQKRRLRDSEELSEDERSPSRQLERELYTSMDASVGGLGSMDTVEYLDDVGEGMDLDSAAEQQGESSCLQPDELGSLPPFDLQPTNPSYNDSPLVPNPPPAPHPTISAKPSTYSSMEALRRDTLSSRDPNFSTRTGVRAARPAHQEVGLEGPQDHVPGKASSSASPRPSPRRSNTPKSNTPRTMAVTKQKTTKAKEKKQPKPSSVEKQHPQENEEEAWPVERLEDDDLYDVEGRGLVRYFKVRWEGDWPPDQNPSWEPEDNIPPNLVRNYFKQGKSRRRRPFQSKENRLKQAKQSAAVAKQYGSVSEAFAGEEELGYFSTNREHGNSSNDMNSGEGNGDDEFFVVDEKLGDGSLMRLAWNGVPRNLLGSWGHQTTRWDI